MLSFDWPWLFLILPLPWLAWRFLPPAAPAHSVLRVPFVAALIHSQRAPDRRRLPRHRLLPLALIWLLLVMAAARPLWLGPPQPVAPAGRDLMLAVDISGSMGTEDMPLDGTLRDRLTAVKEVLADFVERRSGDRLGLILFGTRAYVQSPLTFDHRTLNRLLEEAQIGFAGEKTAIGDAIGLAIKRLTARPARSRVLVLLTDGANTAGAVSPLEAAQVAADNGIRIHTIGIGADELLVESLFGLRRVNPSADLDEALLTRIAATTGGRYFRARDPEALEAIYRELDELEPVEREARWVRPRVSLAHWPLLAALAIAAGWMLIRLLPRNRRHREDS